MAKVLTQFTVENTSGDQHGDSTTTAPVRIRTISNRVDELLNNIDSQNLQEFLRNLSKDFIYPQCIRRYSTNNDHSHGDWWESTYEDYYTRPLIETLFYEHNSLLLQLINKLIEKNNDALYLAFKNALHKSDIKEEMLFSYKPSQISSGLGELNGYGYLLKKQQVKKGETIISLYDSLNEMHKKFQTEPRSGQRLSDKNDLRDEFKNLKFKLEFVTKLHSKDEELSMHRDGGLKKIIGNILLAVFGGLLHLVNRFKTGNWMFFNKTTSEEKVFDVQKGIGFDCEIDSNPKSNI